MELEKAIGILKGFSAAWTLDSSEQRRQAVQLGIEALKECQRARAGDPALDGELLPGETEE